MQVSAYNSARTLDTAHSQQATLQALQAFVEAETLRDQLTKDSTTFPRQVLKLQKDDHGQYVGLRLVDESDITLRERCEAIFFGSGPYKLTNVLSYLCSEQFTAEAAHKSLLERVRDKLVVRMEHYNQRGYRACLGCLFQLDLETFNRRFTRQIEQIILGAKKTLGSEPPSASPESLNPPSAHNESSGSASGASSSPSSPREIVLRGVTVLRQPPDGDCLYHCFRIHLQKLLEKPEYRAYLSSQGIALPAQGNLYTVLEIRKITADYFLGNLRDQDLCGLMRDAIADYNRSLEDDYRERVLECCTFARNFFSAKLNSAQIKASPFHGNKLKEFSKRVISLVRGVKIPTGIRPSTNKEIIKGLEKIQRDATRICLQLQTQEIIHEFSSQAAGSASSAEIAPAPAPDPHKENKARLQALLEDFEKPAKRKLDLVKKDFKQATQGLALPAPQAHSVRDVFQQFVKDIKLALKSAAKEKRREKVRRINGGEERALQKYILRTRQERFWGRDPSMYALARSFHLNIKFSSEREIERAGGTKEKIRTEQTYMKDRVSANIPDVKGQIHLDFQNSEHYNLAQDPVS